MTDPRRTAIAFLHTSPVHVPTFDALVAALSPGTRVAHLVREDLLVDAVALGPEAPEVVARTADAVRTAAASGAAVVVCTCSTIGGIAERVAVPGRFEAMRIDRPMADAAVRQGQGSVLVVAALDSTLGPTQALLQDAVARAARTVRLRTLCVPGAWALFQAGRRDDYVGAVAEAVSAAWPGHDVVVLAQASMSAAAERLGALPVPVPVPVLSSPRLGVEAALARAAARC